MACCGEYSLVLVVAHKSSYKDKTDMFYQQLVNGIMIGSTYALVTIGFNMIYGVLELINFAHSSFYMLGTYFTLFFMTRWLGVPTPIGFLVSLLLSVLVTSFFGASMDKLALEPIRKRFGAPITALLSTIAVQIVINDLILVVFGTRSIPFPDVFKLGKIYIGNTIILNIQIIIFIISILLLVILSFIVYKTKVGGAMRAISQNMNAAKLMGINVNNVITLTFIIACAAAAIAGSFISVYYQKVDTLMGASVGIKSVSAAVLGGMGSLPGSVVGGFIIGVAETLFAAYIHSGYRDVIAFIIMLIVLILKPSGMFGKKIIEKV